VAEKYETIAGLPTVGLTYARLHERLIGCQEDCAMISHLVRAEGSGSKNAALADGWHALSEMFKRVEHQVTMLATKRLN
jgi:hypothetical protein